jgi:outer membrane receptor protein involved in Fe transport
MFFAVFLTKNNIMKLDFTFYTFLLCTLFAFAQNKGTISGTISDKDMKNEPLAFANIAIKGTAVGTTTDAQGKYSLTTDAGNKILVISFLGYETSEVSVLVKENETTVVDKTIGSGNVKLEDIVVKVSSSREKETTLLLDTKKAVEIKQSIGAQEMSRKGISDVEEGLTKITGISKVDGRGLFVRGLEDRYNNLLINDLQAPSNSPFKKIIPLELFPTDIVGVLNVYKTFNPNIPGDFAGATINIETAQSQKSSTKISTGFGYTTQNNGVDFLMSSDATGNKGFFGNLGSDRELPAAYGKNPSGRATTPSEYEADNANNSWNVSNSNAPINNSFGVLHSEKFKLKNNNALTYLFSINGDNAYQVRQGVDRTFNQGQGNYDNNLITSSYTYKTSFSGLAGIKYKTARFGIIANSFLLRSTSSSIQDQLGFTNSLATNPNILIRTNQFEESKYWNNQLLLNYNITADEKQTIKAGISYVKTSFGQPDRKFVTGEKVNPTDLRTTYGGNNLIRQYLDVSGDHFFSGVVEYNFKFNENKYGKSNRIAAGYNGFNNEEVSSYRFIFGRPLFPTTRIVNINNINATITNDVNNGLLKFNEESTADFRSKLLQQVNAGYINGFFNIGEKLEINGGLRIENSNREIKYLTIANSFGDKFLKITTKKLDFLPSVNAKYALTDKTNLRFAGSKTSTRPVSIEVMPIQYVNPDGTVELGNPNLQNSENINIDFKYEIFPNAKEMISVGAFAKQINNPIERIFIPTASSGGQITTYQNSKNAILYGAEFEFLFQLSRINKALDNFSVGFNTSIMKTEVAVDFVKNPLENSAKRALQGAADWLVNADFKYDFKFTEEMKNTIAVVYGITGDKIYAVGTAGLDHIYERPFGKLDFIWSSKITKNIEAKFGVDNILNPTFTRKLGSASSVNIVEKDLTVRSFKRGTGYSLNLSYTF